MKRFIGRILVLGLFMLSGCMIAIGDIVLESKCVHKCPKCGVIEQCVCKNCESGHKCSKSGEGCKTEQKYENWYVR